MHRHNVHFAEKHANDEHWEGVKHRYSDHYRQCWLLRALLYLRCWCTFPDAQRLECACSVLTDWNWNIDVYTCFVWCCQQLPKWRFLIRFPTRHSFRINPFIVFRKFVEISFGCAENRAQAYAIYLVISSHPVQALLVRCLVCLRVSIITTPYSFSKKEGKPLLSMNSQHVFAQLPQNRSPILLWTCIFHSIQLHRNQSQQQSRRVLHAPFAMPVTDNDVILLSIRRHEQLPFCTINLALRPHSA